MAKSTLEYAGTDLPTMQTGLEVFGRTMANVQEYREAYVSFVWNFLNWFKLKYSSSLTVDAPNF